MDINANYTTTPPDDSESGSGQSSRDSALADQSFQQNSLPSLFDAVVDLGRQSEDGSAEIPIWNVASTSKAPPVFPPMIGNAVQTCGLMPRKKFDGEMEGTTMEDKPIQEKLNGNDNDHIVNGKSEPEWSTDPQRHSSIKYRRARLNLNLTPVSNLNLNPSEESDPSGWQPIMYHLGSGMPVTSPTTLQRFHIPAPSRDVQPLPPDIAEHTGNIIPPEEARYVKYYPGSVINLAESVSIDKSTPIEKQGWFHGCINRQDAENLLTTCRVGSYLVRKLDQWRKMYSVALKSLRGFMHIRIYQHEKTAWFIMGSKEEGKQFETIPLLIDYYTWNRLPIQGAQHLSLANPINAQLL